VGSVPDDELNFTVSARELYDLGQTTAQLVREIKEDLTTDRDNAAERHADIETRVRGLERFKWETRGGMTLLAVGVGWLVSLKTGGPA
jgi:hypothetical protein